VIFRYGEGGKLKGREARREREPEGKEWGRTCAEILEAPSAERERDVIQA
jgi:hypothetical protein